MSRFINNLKRRVAKEQKKIVLPESESRRVLQAAERVQAEGFARPILIGRPQSIVEVASEYQIDMDGIEIIDPETYPMMDKFCEYYAKRRAKKGMTLEEARKVLSENYIFFAACLVAFDIADVHFIRFKIFYGCSTERSKHFFGYVKRIFTAYSYYGDSADSRRGRYCADIVFHRKLLFVVIEIRKWIVFAFV